MSMASCSSCNHLKKNHTCPLITRCLAFGKHFLILLPPFTSDEISGLEVSCDPGDLYFSHTENRFLTVIYGKVVKFFIFYGRFYIFKFIDSSFFNLK